VLVVIRFATELPAVVKAVGLFTASSRSHSLATEPLSRAIAALKWVVAKLRDDDLRVGRHGMGILRVQRCLYVPAGSVVDRAATAVTDELQGLSRQAVLRVERVEVGLQRAIVAVVHNRDGLRTTGGNRRSALGTS